MKTSAHGLHFLAQWEGTVLHVYRDQAGLPTIGIGHLLRPGESYPDGITHEQAIALLAQDVSVAEGCVNAHVLAPLSLSQNAFDACVSLTFNIGTGGFTASTVLHRLNSGDMAGAGNAFLMWDKRKPRPGELVRDELTGGMRLPRSGELVVDSGLYARRLAEQELFLTPDGAV